MRQRIKHNNQNPFYHADSLRLKKIKKFLKIKKRERERGREIIINLEN